MKARRTPQEGVSVITCTNRQGFVNNLFHNYKRQRHPRKELIIVVNADRIPLTPYRHLARTDPNVRIFSLPGHHPLGACLNFAVMQARYPYIAKFDDDDYYAPSYLTESLLAIRRAKADIVGKKTHYMYLHGAKALILRFPGHEHQPVAKLPGATLVFKRNAFAKIRFPERSVGEDDLFCMRGKKRGLKVYSAGRHNFVAIRRKNTASHTWTISDRELIAHHKVIPHVRHYKRYVQRNPKDVRP